MTLRSRLALSFALFAAVPLAATSWPVSRALSRALEAEHAARLDGAARAVEGELARLAAEAAGTLLELSRSAEAEALAREHGAGTIGPAEEAGVAAAWSAARGLDVLAVAERDGRVLSSAHLPGRAGDRDAELALLFESSPPGQARPVLVTRAGPAGPERTAALVAWAEVPSETGPLRIAGGRTVAAPFGERLAALTGCAITVLSPDGSALAEAAPPGDAPGRRWRRLEFLLGRIGGAARTIPLGPPEAPAALVEVALSSEGLARARALVLLAFGAVLLAAAVAAAVAGRVLASRVTRPVEALRAAAARVAEGDLGARVAPAATGEVGELVRAFNAMTADLAAGRERLAQAERVAAWREVARRLAHEIKNPLTPIAMSVETIRDAREKGRGDFGEIFDEGTRAIAEEVRRLKRIVDEFSRFARLPAPEREPIAPEELVGGVLALFPAPPHGVELRRDPAPGLPAVLADRDQVIQVLLNLVRNALDAMPGGGVLRVSARPDGPDVLFEVADTGPGIAPDDLPRVFEPYFTTKQGGTGLGLAIARRIAEEHGGALAAESGPGGSCFTLRLPAAAGTSPVEARAGLAAKEPPGPRSP